MSKHPLPPASASLRRRDLGLMGLGAALAATPLRAKAQTSWPSRPVRLVAPFGAGGASDTLARAVAQHFAPLANGQPLVVENRTGAGGTIAGAHVAQSRPDGYTLMLADLGPNAVGADIYPNLPYDPATAFTPVIHLVNIPMALIGRRDMAARNLAELLAQARERPDAFSYASAGAGNTNHLFVELLLRQAGARMTHVPYRSGAEVVTAVMRGEVAMSMPSAFAAAPLIREGAIRGLGVGSPQRIAMLPDVPPIAETVPGFNVSIWHGIVGPAGIPPEIVARANAIFGQILALPELREGLERSQGAEIVGGSPERWGQHIQSEIARWRPVIREAGIRA